MTIGILAHKHTGRHQDGYGQNEAYIEYFRRFGNVIMVDAQADVAFPFIDLLVLPGGADVNPMRYGEKPHRMTQKPDLEYEWFFENTFHQYVEMASRGELAIYGICAGFQNLNVYFGGKVNQDIVQTQSTKYRGELVDFLKLDKRNLATIFPDNLMEDQKVKDWIYATQERDMLMTNSIHHQGVYNKKYSQYYPHTQSDQMLTLAYNKDFGNVEYMAHKELPIACEQSHPEERDNPEFTNMLILSILKRAAIMKEINQIAMQTVE